MGRRGQVSRKILKPKIADKLYFSIPDLVVEETGKFVPEQQAYLQLARTAGILQNDLKAFFKSYKLSEKQYNALRAVRRAGYQGITC